MRMFLAIAATSLLAIGLPACGDSGDSTTTTAKSEAAATTTAPPKKTPAEELPLLDETIYDSELRYAADPERTFAFHISEASASAGKVDIEFVNPQSIPHNLAVEAPSGETIGKTKPVVEGVAKMTVVVKPGEYVLYCSLPGHRKRGMVGHLTVQ